MKHGKVKWLGPLWQPGLAGGGLEGRGVRSRWDQGPLQPKPSCDDPVILWREHLSVLSLRDEGQQGQKTSQKIEDLFIQPYNGKQWFLFPSLYHFYYSHREYTNFELQLKKKSFESYFSGK